VCVWDGTEIGGSGSSRIASVTASSIEATAVTLTWTLVAATAPDRYQVIYTANLDTPTPVFTIVTPPAVPGAFPVHTHT
jgi:hypothetical protein